MIKKENIKTVLDILNTPTTDIYEWYTVYYKKEIPYINDIGLQEVGDLITEVGNYFVYFSTLHAQLNTMVQEAKARKLGAESYKNIMIRRDILGTFAEECKFTYTAISRICTMRIEGNKELEMLSH